MLQDIGCRYVIVGHSERRAYHHEGDQLVADKAKAALAHGVTPIVCVGETLAEREAGRTEEVVKRQLAAVIHTLTHCIGEIVVAYEPVWAIGTGLTACPSRRRPCTMCCASSCRRPARRPMRCASSTAAASSPTMRPSSLPRPISTAA